MPEIETDQDSEKVEKKKEETMEMDQGFHVSRYLIPTPAPPSPLHPPTPSAGCRYLRLLLFSL